MTQTLTFTWLNIFGLAVGATCLLAWLWLFWPFVVYSLWRLSGGGWRSRRSEGVGSFYEFFGLGARRIFEANTSRRLYADLPIQVGEVPIPSEFSALAGSGGAQLSMEVTFSRLFDIASHRVRRGCHGHYPLARSLFYSELFGGDPRCGGGQKRFFAPRLRQWLENALVALRVRHDFTKGIITGYVVSYAETLTLNAYADDGKRHHSYLRVFLESESTVRDYMEQCGNTGYRMFPVTVRLA